MYCIYIDSVCDILAPLHFKISAESVHWDEHEIVAGRKKGLNDLPWDELTTITPNKLLFIKSCFKFSLTCKVQKWQYDRSSPYRKVLIYVPRVAQLHVEDGYFLEGSFPAADKLGHISIHTGSHIDPWTNEFIAENQIFKYTCIYRYISKDISNRGDISVWF